jgi:hypothetical protein
MDLTISVTEAKPNGTPWDGLGDPPDIAVCIEGHCWPDGDSPRRVRHPLCQDKVPCSLREVMLTPDSRIKIDVVDVDGLFNDEIASGSCKVANTCFIGSATLTFSKSGDTTTAPVVTADVQQSAQTNAEPAIKVGPYDARLLVPPQVSGTQGIYPRKINVFIASRTPDRSERMELNYDGPDDLRITVTVWNWDNDPVYSRWRKVSLDSTPGFVAPNGGAGLAHVIFRVGDKLVSVDCLEEWESVLSDRSSSKRALSKTEAEAIAVAKSLATWAKHISGMEAADRARIVSELEEELRRAR